jgi:hypothetical protein
MRHRTLIILGLGLLALGVPALACSITLPEVRTQPGELRHESVQVSLGDAASADVNVTFGAGRLNLYPAQIENLLEADFTYNVDELKPVVEEDRREDRLEVKLHPKVAGLSLDLGAETRNEWDVRLSDRAPLSLNLDLGAAEGRVDLGGLRLSQTRIRTGVADLDLEWSQPNPQVLDELNVEAGAASLNLRQLGNAHFDEMRFTGGAGNFELDFTGDWQGPARANIDAGFSNLRLVLPDNIGVKVSADEKALANVNAEGFSRRGNAWVNEAYTTDDEALVITVNIGLGNLTLEKE